MENWLKDEISKRGCDLSFVGWLPLDHRKVVRAELLCKNHWVISCDEQPEDSTEDCLENCKKAMYVSLWLYEDDQFKGVAEEIDNEVRNVVDGEIIE